MAKKYCFPEELSVLKSKVLQVLQPIRQVPDGKILPFGRRTNAGRELPEYYLCYFLFVKLLEFNFLGKSEKSAWAIPIFYNNNVYIVEHKKLGLGLFGGNSEESEPEAQEIVRKIIRAVQISEPFFDWNAQIAVQGSSLNVVNNHQQLFGKLQYFKDKYSELIYETDTKSVEVISSKNNYEGMLISCPSYILNEEAMWLAHAFIDAFFSWTEHIFIHIAILKGDVCTGELVADMADTEWSDKFKKSIGIRSPKAKNFYDQLIKIRRQIRNYIAHGAFGKKGEAFRFHSEAGAIPILMPHKKDTSRFQFLDGFNIYNNDIKYSVKLIEDFISYLWTEEREAAKEYIYSGLPLILTMAKDGTYKKAMISESEMVGLVYYLENIFDNAANMDW